MRSSTHRLKCSHCPAAIELTMSGVHWYEQAKRYLDRIAEVEQWTLEPAACPRHREGTP